MSEREAIMVQKVNSSNFSDLQNVSERCSLCGTSELWFSVRCKILDKGRRNTFHS